MGRATAMTGQAGQQHADGRAVDRWVGHRWTAGRSLAIASVVSVVSVPMYETVWPINHTQHAHGHSACSLASRLCFDADRRRLSLCICCWQLRVGGLVGFWRHLPLP